MRISAAAIATITLALAGCGQSEPEATAPAQGTAAPRSSPGGFADAVSAVLGSEGQPLAGVSFLIEAAPVAGKPFAVKLFVTAAQPVSGVQVAIESADLIAAPAAATVNVAGTQSPVEIDLVVTAQKAGLWELAVSLRTAEAAAPTLYRIPVLVTAAG